MVKIGFGQLTVEQIKFQVARAGVQRPGGFKALIEKENMFTLSRLPGFIDYLNSYYHHLYEVYAGKLTELFPSYDGSESNLSVQDSDEGSPEEKEQVLKLWRSFQQ